MILSEKELERRHKIGAANSISLIGKHCSPKTEFKNGNIPWNKGVPQSDIAKKKNADNHIGRPVWNKGLKGKQTAWNKGRNWPEEFKQRMSKSKKGRHFNLTWEWTSERMSIISKRNWQNPIFRAKMLSPELRKKRFHFCQPTRPEILIISVIDQLNISLQYTGQGEVWIGNHNPDFIDEKRKIIVELFGEPFHDPKGAFFKAGKMTENELLDYYKHHGYRCLVIWDRAKKRVKRQEILDSLLQLYRSTI